MVVLQARSMLDPRTLDLAHLALFVGNAFNARVIAALGDDRLRESHGYLVQHLIEGPRSIGELAKALGVTQQAVSKAVAEMGGLLEDAPVPSTGADRRVRWVQLSARGRAVVQRTRATRRRLDARLRRALGAARVDAARTVLVDALDQLGGLDAVRRRGVRPPR